LYMCNVGCALKCFTVNHVVTWLVRHTTCEKCLLVSRRVEDVTIRKLHVKTSQPTRLALNISVGATFVIVLLQNGTQPKTWMSRRSSFSKEVQLMGSPEGETCLLSGQGGHESYNRRSPWIRLPDCTAREYPRDQTKTALPT
jgi:hypothetical protein